MGGFYYYMQLVLLVFFKVLTLQHDPGISVEGLSYPNWSHKFCTVQMFWQWNCFDQRLYKSH